MELTLIALARARTLFEAGQSVEEVYEALSERSPPVAGRMQQAADRKGSADAASLTVVTARASYLPELGERLHKPSSHGAAGAAIPGHEVFRRAEPAHGGGEDKAAASERPVSSAAAAGDPQHHVAAALTQAVSQIALLKDGESRRRNRCETSARAI